MNTEKPERIVVIGLGGGGGKIVNYIATNDDSTWLDLAVVDTDTTDLKNYTKIQQIAIGTQWAENQGCGGDIAKGGKAAGESVNELKKFIEGAHILIVVTTLGGGTGGGAAPVIARQAKSLKIMTLFLTTAPFSFEGNARFNNAKQSLSSLRKISDAVISIQNDLLFKTISSDISAKDCFKIADEVISKCIIGLAELITCRGLVTVDFAQIRKILEKYDTQCTMGTGEGKGLGKIDEAITEMLSSPVLGGSEMLHSANAAIITVSGDEELSFEEATNCIEQTKKMLHEDCEVIVGINTDNLKKGTIKLTVLIINYTDRQGNISKAKQKETKNIQDELPLTEQSTGIFSAQNPTTYKGENLDIPTFLRKNRVIDDGNDS